MTRTSIKGLQVFEAVGRCGTVTLAARELGVSPGAVSQQMRNLEDNLGVALLERKGRQVEMTTWGRLYHHEISKGFQQLVKATDILERARTENTLTLSALSSVANRWIGTRIFDWQALHPEAKIKINGQENEPKLGQEPVDFRITYGKRFEAHEHYTELYTDWVVPVCSPRLLDGRSLHHPSEILSFPLLSLEWEEDFLPPPSWADWAHHIQADDKLKLSSCQFSLSSSAIGAAVNARGFALAQISMIDDELKAGSLIIPFDIRLKLAESYVLAWDRSALQKPFGLAFQRWIVQMARRQGQISQQQN